jgi:hypothetical protein
MFLEKGSENYAPFIFAPRVEQLHEEKCGNAHCYAGSAGHLFFGAAG